MTARYHHALRRYTGTNTERTALSTTELKLGVQFFEIDTDEAFIWNGTSWVQDDVVTQFADYDSGNYSEFEADGTLEFNGDATVWEDIRVPLEKAKLQGANVPTYTQFKTDGAGSNGVYVYQFDDGDEIFLSVQMPHAWKEGSYIYPHIHWGPTTDVDPSDNVGLGLEYTWQNINGTFGNTTIETRDVPTGVNTADDHLIHNVPENGIDGTGYTLSSVLVCRIFRQAAVADNYADSIWIYEFDIHYEIDTVGSRQRTSK